MDQRVHDALVDQRGALAGAELRRLGATAASTRAAVRRGEVVRVRRGALVEGARYRAATSTERYALRVRAVMHSRPGDAAWRHAALAMYGLPLWDVDLHRIDLLGDVRASTYAGDLAIHPRAGREVVWLDGLPVADLAAAVVSTAACSGVAAGVVAADAALGRGMFTSARLAQVAAIAPAPRGSRRVAQTLALADPASESPGESVTRVALVLAGFRVRSQVSITDGGSFVARVDLLVGDRVVVEFDGALKYADGDGRTVFREKVREDRLRALGYAVLRVTWSDLRYPERIVRRVRALLAQRG